jgi:p-cumate 2,3-dioxygenase subunit beta
MFVSVDGAVTQQAVEQFLFHEAALLDEWRLEEWEKLLSHDVRYEVPTMDGVEGEPGRAIYLIADDAERLRSRVKALQGKTTMAEMPRSRTRRFITNVRFRPMDGGRIDVRANFQVCRFRNQQKDVYVGRYEHILVVDSGLKFLRRRSVLDLESLNPERGLTVIL